MPARMPPSEATGLQALRASTEGRGRPRPGRTEHDALRAAVVAAGERAEALLAGGVPDGQLQALAAHGDKLEPKVDACARAPRLARPGCAPLGLRRAAWVPDGSLALALRSRLPQT